MTRSWVLAGLTFLLSSLTAQAQVQLSEWEAKCVAAVNNERSKLNLAPLKVNAKLMTAARNYSATMAKLKVPYFKITHEIGGKNLATRVKEVNYSYSTGGENAYGSAMKVTPERAVNSLMDSKYHRSNILGSRFMDIGVGVAQGSNGTFYVTQIFATQVGRKAPKFYRAGTLTQKSPLIKALQKYHDIVALKLKAGDRVTIDLFSPDFDTFLVVNNSKDMPIAFNDDVTKGNTNSRVVLQAQQEGTFYLIVTSFQKLKTGRFELTVTE